MDERLKAGADIHSGDGGYSIGNKEDHDRFVENRNRSLRSSRIKELAEQASKYKPTDCSSLTNEQWLEKFAELIVQDCCDYIRNNHDSWEAEPLAFCMGRDFGLHGDYA